ncbi:Cocaine- and amphetamine-regulated transcript protein CART(1-39) CART(42-89) [Triplophysa tibetana]|uniref:Cocaine-and amphetamine-regulated transcript protein CART(1-39) CART(42-89) n=1 Tax=Triplophysa tibetana TaxID=1572043 RepID=A0A5A9NM66_9TELE|nr:Cocaine- and amphetamine-regulated transcript protein CART(1-39) CART(42-89) [Triplophysa tibetana]
MDSIRAAVYLSICLSLLCVCRGQMSTDNQLSSQEEQFIKKDLVEALEELLDGEQDSRLSVEKRASVIPRCDVGERCAMKHGPRIGRLCDCMRGTACNTFFLRCY